MYCLLERSIKHPQRFLADKGDGRATNTQARELLREGLLNVCRDWAGPLHGMAHRTDTHDIGFIVEPALRRDYELTSNPQSLKSIVLAAENLASRYSDYTQAIRSWDTFVNNKHRFTSKETDFLVIIDSMCSTSPEHPTSRLVVSEHGPQFRRERNHLTHIIDLDLLYYAGNHTSNRRLINIATIHAHTVRRTHLMKQPTPEDSSSTYPLFSTCHVANLCPDTGRTRQTLTAQGYSDTSTWARGQAWAILGYAQTYMWTKDPVFLSTARGLADFFMIRLETSPACVEVERNGRRVGRHVPLWDFDAPVDENDPLRDSSAAMIAANGMLVLYGALTAAGDLDGAQRYLHYALTIVNDTIALCYVSDCLELAVTECSGGRRVVARAVDGCTEPFEALLRCATANFNENWTEKFANHGLVYGDYYLLEFGNRLLNAGLW